MRTPRQQAALWNAHYPPGSPVRYWPDGREGDSKIGLTRLRAFGKGGLIAVVKIEDEPAPIALDDVVPLAKEAHQALLRLRWYAEGNLRARDGLAESLAREYVRRHRVRQVNMPTLIAELSQPLRRQYVLNARSLHVGADRA